MRSPRPARTPPKPPPRAPSRSSARSTPRIARPASDHARRPQLRRAVPAAALVAAEDRWRVRGPGPGVAAADLPRPAFRAGGRFLDLQPEDASALRGVARD